VCCGVPLSLTRRYVKINNRYHRKFPTKAMMSIELPSGTLGKHRPYGAKDEKYRGFVIMAVHRK